MPRVLVFVLLQGFPETMAFVLSQSTSSGPSWDARVLAYLVSALAVPSPAIQDVYEAGGSGTAGSFR